MHGQQNIKINVCFCHVQFYLRNVCTEIQRSPLFVKLKDQDQSNVFRLDMLRHFSKRLIMTIIQNTLHTQILLLMLTHLLRNFYTLPTKLHETQTHRPHPRAY